MFGNGNKYNTLQGSHDGFLLFDFNPEDVRRDIMKYFGLEILCFSKKFRMT